MSTSNTVSIAAWDTIPCDKLIKQLKQQIEMLEMITVKHNNPTICSVDIKLTTKHMESIDTSFLVMCSNKRALNYNCNGDLRPFEFAEIDHQIGVLKIKP